MPCFTERLVNIQFTAESREHLQNGLLAAGWRIVSQNATTMTVVNQDGVQATIYPTRVQVAAGQEDVVNDIKRAYATEVVKATAKRYGWMVQFDRADQQKMTLKRR